MSRSNHELQCHTCLSFLRNGFKFTAYFLRLLHVWDVSLYFIHVGVTQHDSGNKTENIEQWLRWQLAKQNLSS